jgi:branched-chain amino acid aminotransferase
LTPDRAVDPTIVVVVDPLPPGGVDADPSWDGPALLQTVQTRRPPANSLPPEGKTHNYLNGLMARLELRQAATEGAPADEAIVCDIQGAVCEGTTSNLFFVDDGELKTPSADLPLLPGITREIVLDVAREDGFPVSTGRYSPDAFRTADEVFATNSVWGVRPVGTVDGVDLDVGPMTELLQRRYDERVDAACYASD